MAKFITATRQLSGSQIPVVINIDSISWINRYNSDSFTRIVFNGADKDGMQSINVQETVDELTKLIQTAG